MVYHEVSAFSTDLSTERLEMGGTGSSLMNYVTAEMVESELVKEMKRLYTERSSGDFRETEDMAFCFSKLESSIVSFQEKYGKGRTEYLEEKEENSAWTQEALAFSDVLEKYNTMKDLYNYSVGDVVQVKTPKTHYFVEGIVCNIQNDLVDIQIPDESIEASEYEVVTNINIESESLRKIHNWDHLRINDTVRVHDGHIFVLSNIIAISEDGDEITVSFAKSMDFHDISDSEESESEEPNSIEAFVFPRSAVTKVNTSHFASVKLEKMFKEMRTTICVANAFSLGNK